MVAAHQGTATTESGAPLPGASLILRGPISAGLVSTAAGQFSSMRVPAGQYAATCEAQGYNPMAAFTVTVANGAVTAADCPMSSAGTPGESDVRVRAFGQTEADHSTAELSRDQRGHVEPSPAVGTVDGSGLYTAPAGLTANQTVIVTATSTNGSGATASATLTVGPAILLSGIPASVVGGNAVAGVRIRIGEAAPAGGMPVTLTSSNPAAAAPPTTVIVPEGAVDSPAFTITTTGIASAAPVVISASVPNGSVTAAITVNPAVLQSVTLGAASLAGGSAPASRVYLSGQSPPSGTVVSLVSSNPAVLSVPAEVTVPPGQASAVVPAASYSVSQSTPVVVTATSGGVSRTAAVTVFPVELLSVTMAASIPSGTAGTANRVTLTGPAPAGGYVVALTSSATQLTVPLSITVPAGATSVLFTATAAAADAPIAVTVTATMGSASKSASTTITPAVLKSLYMAASVTGGVSSTGTVY